MSAKLPALMQSCLWSYDISKIDPQKDQNLIITQALSFGSQQQIDWVLSRYSPDQIRSVVSHPQRGMWLRPSLYKWLNYFGIMIDPLEYESGIRDLNPRPKLVTAFFQQRGLI